MLGRCQQLADPKVKEQQLAPVGKGRPVGDTSSNAVYLNGLCERDSIDIIRFNLGELLGRFGKIKKIIIYPDILGDIQGDATVVFHKGAKDHDPARAACEELDGKWKCFGRRMYKVDIVPAVFGSEHKHGYDEAEHKRLKQLLPCVDISNMFDVDKSRPEEWYHQLQEAVRQDALQHGAKKCFSKADPDTGCICLYFYRASDALEQSKRLHGSEFEGRRILAGLSRKARPKVELTDNQLRRAIQDTMDAVAKEEDEESKTLVGIARKSGATKEKGTAAYEKAADKTAQRILEEAAAAAYEEEKAEIAAAKLRPGKFRDGARVVLRGLSAKPDFNGRGGTVVGYNDEKQRYDVRLDEDPKLTVQIVQLRPQNIMGAAVDMKGGSAKNATEEDDSVVRDLLKKSGVLRSAEDSDEEKSPSRSRSRSPVVFNTHLFGCRADRQAARREALEARGVDPNDPHGKGKGDGKGKDGKDEKKDEGFAGDWRCTRCHDLNRVKNLECHRCGAPKPEEGAMSRAQEAALVLENMRASGYVPGQLPSGMTMEEEKEAEKKKAEDRASWEERRKKRMEDALAAAGGTCSWNPSANANTANAGSAKATGVLGQVEQSREELFKMSIGELKKLIVKHGYSARGCLEKKDFVDKLKPEPKA